MTKHFMSNIHIIVDMLRMYLMVKVYQKAGVKDWYVYLLMLF